MVPNDQKCVWSEGGRVLTDNTAKKNFDCPENSNKPVNCTCNGDGERMHGAPEGPVSSSLIEADGAPIFPNIGRETCSYSDNGSIKSRLSIVTGNKWDPNNNTWPDPKCPFWRLVDFY